MPGLPRLLMMLVTGKRSVVRCPHIAGIKHTEVTVFITCKQISLHCSKAHVHHARYMTHDVSPSQITGSWFKNRGCLQIRRRHTVLISNPARELGGSSSQRRVTGRSVADIPCQTACSLSVKCGWFLLYPRLRIASDGGCCSYKPPISDLVTYLVLRY